MNQKNVDFLKDGLKYLGFGEGLNNKLTEEINNGKREFQLYTTNDYGKDKVSYTLDFRKSEQSDMYFFNKYNAYFKPEGSSTEMSQTFYLNKNSGITAKEAYNLLNSRAVYTDLTDAEGEKFKAWVKLDLSQKDEKGNYKLQPYYSGYGYDLQKELQKYPIKELGDVIAKERLMQSLERGNLHQVTFVKQDKEDKMYIEANPQFKTLNIFDASLKKVFIEHQKKNVETQKIETQSQPKEEEKEKKDELKKGNKLESDEDSPGKGKKVKKTKVSV